MIKQNINLYQAKFKPKKLILSTQHMVLIWAVLLLALLGFSYYQHATNQSLEKEKVNFEIQLKELASTNKSLEKSLKKQKESASQESIKNENIIKKIKQYQEMLAFLANQKSFHTKDFSKYLVALSENSAKGIWLHSIDIEANGAYLRLQGTATEPAEITKYIDRLSTKISFNNLLFKQITIEQDKNKKKLYKFSLSTKHETNDIVQELINGQ